MCEIYWEKAKFNHFNWSEIQKYSFFNHGSHQMVRNRNLDPSTSFRCKKEAKNEVDQITQYISDVYEKTE